MAATALDVTLHRSESPLDRDPALQHIVAVASLCVDTVPQVSPMPQRAACVRARRRAARVHVDGQEPVVTLELGERVLRRHGSPRRGLSLHVSLALSLSSRAARRRRRGRGRGGAGAGAGFWTLRRARRRGARARRARCRARRARAGRGARGRRGGACAADIGGYVELSAALRATAAKPSKRRRRGSEKGHQKGANAEEAGAETWAAALLGTRDEASSSAGRRRR